MLWGSQRTMEGVQKYEGGRCEEGGGREGVVAVGHSEHVAAGTVRSITQAQRGFKTLPPGLPPEN